MIPSPAEKPKNYSVSSRSNKRTVEAERVIDEMKKEGLELVEGELEKTPSELKLIGMMNEWFEQEFRELGLSENYFKISPKRVHLLSDEGWEDYSKKNGGFNDLVAGVCTVQKSAMYICKSRCCTDIIGHFGETEGRRFTQTAVYATVLHEAVHLMSREKFHLEEEQKEEIKAEDIRHLKGGLAVLNYPKKHKHLVVLNEAVTDTIAKELFKKHGKECKPELGVDKRDFNEPDFEMEILDKMIKTMAKYFQCPDEEIWKEFKKAAFSGNFLGIIRKINKVFGKEALGKLDKVVRHSQKSPYDVLQFFSQPKSAS